MNGWLVLGYAVVVLGGLKFLDSRTWGQLDCDYFPAIFITFINVVIFWAFIVAEVSFLAAIPLASLITMGLCKLTSSQSIKSIWLSSIYLSLWIYLIGVLFYFISFFAVLVAGLGGFSEPDDPYYY